MTDIKSTIAELRYLADWAQHHLDKAKIANDAAESIEALQGENERLDRETADLAMLADQYKAERDALAAKLDELQRQEPVIDFTVLHQFANDQAISYNKLCTAVRMCLAAPKALEPLTDEQSATLFQALKDDPRSAKFSVKNWFTCGLVTAEAAHGITKGTPT